MENQTNNEPVVINKWYIRLKKYTIGIIILGIIYGFGCMFYPLLNVGVMMLMTSPSEEYGNKLTDYYYVNIGGITYAKDKFYILLNKPYLFNRNHGYIYSSKDLVNWDEEASFKKLVGSMTSIYYYPDRYYVDAKGYSLFKDDDSNSDTNFSLPREIDGNCYVVWKEGLVSQGCGGKWSQMEYLNQSEQSKFESSFYNSRKFSTIENLCNFVTNEPPSIGTKALQKYLCIPILPKQNLLSYQVISKIIAINKLDILIDGSHTTYGDGKYVGIFYKNKQYYFIISTDGVHYEIKPAPEELTSSLAIKLFN